MLRINRVIILPTFSSGYSELYCRSQARSVASRKSGGAVSESCRKTMQRCGTWRRRHGAGTQRGAGVSEIGWSAERVTRHSHDLDACYSVVCL